MMGIWIGFVLEHTDSAVDPEVLRYAMRQWATGVTVVSAKHDGEQHGMTVSSFTSITLSPPLVLVSLEQGTRTHKMVSEAGFLAVTILNQNQQVISDRFAGRDTEDQDRFDGLETFTLKTGAPFLADGLAGFDCCVIGSYDFDDHTVFVCEVVAAQRGNGDQPLIYYDRAYRKLNS